ncbi:MAG: sulfatase-like hydrolase/transferase [Planctomycetota bacterium]
MRDSRPNILLITTDQQRYDTLGCCGAEWMRTPNLDALAKRGVIFRHAYTQNPVCIPARACIQTGRYTHQHGVQYMESIIDNTPGLPPWEITIMERLQSAGYRTAAFGKIHMMPEKGFHELKVCGGKGGRWTKSAGLEIGLGPLGRDYAAWLEERHPGGYEAIYEQRRRPEYKAHKSAIVNVLPLEEYVDYWTPMNTIDFIKHDHDRPFFVWCGFCGPHGPVDPPRPYHEIYPMDKVEFPPNYHVKPDGSLRETTPEEDEVARRFIAYYYGLVMLIDDMVGEIVKALEKKGLLDNTLILFTSDHGEMMFDHGRLGKGNFTEPIIRMPLIVVPPGGKPGVSDVDGLVETFDIAPTVLDYAWAGIPTTMSASSLRPLIEGGGSAKEIVMCEYMRNDRSTMGTCVRTKRYKYACWTNGQAEQFYDLQEDPLERRNAIGDPEYRDEIERHRVLMIDRLMQSSRQQPIPKGEL